MSWAKRSNAIEHIQQAEGDSLVDSDFTLYTYSYSHT